MWKADVVESWIADKETHVKSEDFGRDLSTVQTLLTKQETFDAGERAGERSPGGRGPDGTGGLWGLWADAPPRPSWQTRR